MKKFMMDVKAAVGTAPKTEDTDYDEKSKAVKEIDKAIREYTQSVDRMKAAAKTMSQALDNVVKSFATLTGPSDTPESMKKVATTCEEAVKKIHDQDLYAYIKALEDESSSPVKDIKTKIDDLRKVEDARNKVMAEYDTYRESVSSKEKECEKKGKKPSESKHYNEDVKKRDELKSKFDEENKKFKEQADAINKRRLEAFLHAMKEFSGSTAMYFSSVEKNMETVCAAAKKAKH